MAGVVLIKDEFFRKLEPMVTVSRGGSTGGGATAPPTKVLGGHCPSNKPWQLNLSMGGYVQLTK